MYSHNCLEFATATKGYRQYCSLFNQTRLNVCVSVNCMLLPTLVHKTTGPIPPKLLLVFGGKHTKSSRHIGTISTISVNL